MATGSAIFLASPSGSITSPRWASRPSGSRRSTSRRWRTSVMTSPITARSTRSSARWPTSTASSTRRMRSELKVIVDQVLSHTSDQHAWFLESRQSRDNPKHDWYVWADARADGTPPNNWLSIFGGVAWTWEPRRGQYYLHNFLKSQPDLNFHNAEVRRASLDNMRFWLERGVDGLRLDAINFCFHDAKLRDNPPRPEHERKAQRRQCRQSVRIPMAPAQQHAARDAALPGRNPALARRVSRHGRARGDLLRRFDRDGSRIHAARPSAHGLQLRAAGQRQLAATHSRHRGDSFAVARPQSWPCWTISNHDVERVVSRWGWSNSPAHAPRSSRRWCARCADRYAYSRARSWDWVKRRCRTNRCAIPTASRSGPRSRAAMAAARPCPGIQTNEAVFERRAMAAGATSAPGIVRGRAGARPLLGVEWLSAAARLASRSGAPDLRRHRIPRRHRFGTRLSSLRRARRPAGRIQLYRPRPRASRCRRSMWRAHIGGHGLPEGSFASAYLDPSGSRRCFLSTRSALI